LTKRLRITDKWVSHCERFTVHCFIVEYFLSLSSSWYFARIVFRATYG